MLREIRDRLGKVLKSTKGIAFGTSRGSQKSAAKGRAAQQLASGTSLSDQHLGVDKYIGTDAGQGEQRRGVILKWNVGKRDGRRLMSRIPFGRL